MQPRLAALAVFALLAGCGDNPAPDDAVHPPRAPEIARITPAAEALAGARVPALDPSTMNDAELRKAIGTGPRCAFRYTTAGRPVFAAGMPPNQPPAGGVVKVNGHLIPLDRVAEADDAPGGVLGMAAGPIGITIRPDAGPGETHNGTLRREADMIFQIGQDLRVGYRGYWECTSKPPVESATH